MNYQYYLSFYENSALQSCVRADLLWADFFISGAKAEACTHRN